MAAEKVLFAENSIIRLDKKRKTFLNKRGFQNDIDFIYDTPLKYYDVTSETSLLPSIDGKFVLLKGECRRITDKTCRNGSLMIKIELSCMDHKNNPCPVYVTYFSNASYRQSLESYIGQRCAVAGTAQLFGGLYYITNPIAFMPDRYFTSKVLTVYSKHKGISNEWMHRTRNAVMKMEKIKETIPDEIRTSYGIPGRKEALLQLHSPSDAHSLQSAIKQQLIEDLLYLACVNEREKRSINKNCRFIVKGLQKTKSLLNRCPYKLTDDQKKVLNDITLKMMQGRHVSALVQGDVGCGKTIVAFLLMTGIAENGFQSVLMAPTTLLAEQHYKDLLEFVKDSDLNCALLTGNLTASSRKKALKDIANGTAQLVVGTHSMISDSVVFKDLGLAIVDEEHRFGAKARNTLIKHGCHSINFTATPIPRTVAQTVFSLRDVYEIKTLPPGRVPVDTKIYPSLEESLCVVKEEIEKGHQAYVVCPFIDPDSEDDERSPASVIETAQVCGQYLGIPIGVITGKDKGSTFDETLLSFKEGKLKLLCATTVIEVGVNIPNASVIVILDAWRFGLAQLHQLRGRVGRGDTQGKCLLVSDHDTERLKLLEETSDGFEIATYDFKNRGGGEILGLRQSGYNRFLQEAFFYPNYYKSICKSAKIMVDNDQDKILIDEMEKRSEKIYLNSSRMKLYSS